MNSYSFGLPVVLSKAVEGIPLEKNEIRYLLMLKRGVDIDLLHRVARLVRSRYFGYRIFLYGFLCMGACGENDDNCCRQTGAGEDSVRFGKSGEEVLAAAMQLRDSGVHLIELAMGQDSTMFHPEFGLRRLQRLVDRVKSATGLPVLLSPGGALPEKTISHVSVSQAEWRACCREASGRELFELLREGQLHGERMASKVQAKRNGILVKEGLTGVRETVEDIVNSLVEMRSMKADQVRVKTCVPRQGAPMAPLPGSQGQFEEIVISVMRLVLPGSLIPASMDSDGLSGLQRKLHAGANVVTSIGRQVSGLAGSAGSPSGVAGSKNVVEEVCAELQCCGLNAATAMEFQDWLESRSKMNSDGYLEPERAVNCRYWS